MTRRMICAAGAMLLVSLNGWTSPADAQGAMAPRMDVAPPPVRVAPPAPVFVPPVVPTPPPMPVAPVMAPPLPTPKTPTASAPATPTPATPASDATPTPAPPPATASRETPRGPAGGPPPYTDSQVKALRGVGVSLRGPGGQRRVSSDGNGVVSLGKLGPGRLELTIDRKSLGTGGDNQPVIVGLLLPAVQRAREGARRYATVVVQPVNDPPPLQIKVDVDSRGQVTAIDWGNGIGVKIAAGDVNGDGRADIRLLSDLAKRNTSGETRLVFVASVPGSNAAALADVNTVISEVSTARLGTSPGNPTGPGKPTAQEANVSSSGSVIAAEAPISTTRSNIKHAIINLPNVGTTAKGPGGVTQARSDGEGWTRLGRLPVGNTVIEFNGADLASALKATVGPSTPIPQKTLIEPLVVIAILAVKTDGTPIVFTGSVPANAVKTLKADLRVGRDGNAMTVDWGNGPQLPQPLPRTGAATLTVQGVKGTYTLEPVLVTSLQAKANNSAPGMVDATAAIGDVVTIR